MQRLPGEVIAEPEGCCVITSFPLGVDGVSQPRFDRRIARWRDVPFGAKHCISGLEVWVDERTQVEGNVVLKAKYSCKFSKPQPGIQLNSVRGKSDRYDGRSTCGIGNEGQVASVLMDVDCSPFNRAPPAHASKGPVICAAMEYHICKKLVEIGLVVGATDLESGTQFRLQREAKPVKACEVFPVRNCPCAPSSKILAKLT